MTSKLTFSELSKSKSLEIKMSNILSFYEDIATTLAFKSDPVSYEVITADDSEQIESNNEPVITTAKNSIIKNVLKFTKPLQRSSDVVDYLIEREQLEYAKLSLST